MFKLLAAEADCAASRNKKSVLQLKLCDREVDCTLPGHCNRCRKLLLSGAASNKVLEELELLLLFTVLFDNLINNKHLCNLIRMI